MNATAIARSLSTVSIVAVRDVDGLGGRGRSASSTFSTPYRLDGRELGSSASFITEPYPLAASWSKKGQHNQRARGTADVKVVRGAESTSLSERSISDRAVSAAEVVLACCS